MNTSTDTLTTTNTQQTAMTNNTITPMNYPINAHITIHYQNWNNNNNTSPQEEKEATPRNFEDLSFSSSSSSSNKSSSSSLNNLILPKHNNSYSFSHNYKNNNTQQQIDTPLRIVQTVLNISNQYNHPDIEQCQNTTNIEHNNNDSITPLIRRFSEPIYIDRNDLLDKCVNDDDHIEGDCPHGNVCTRHHHRRNSIAIKFNKPLYKKCL